ncbi:MAG: carbohydrate kinase family protein [Planctomycetaceae bacterium]|jgi:sugar/nucleoside kinase (ribokinase family)|nr:carbohydrate kinase family protein [Planctomycetaceae bacterium]
MYCICNGILFADVACFPISHIPAAGELLTTERIELNLGGCAANVAFDLARLGVSVAVAGCVGDDAFSDFIVRAISLPTINVDFLQHSPQNCPGTAIHINVRNEDRRFICTTGANDNFVFDDKLIKFITSETKRDERKILYLGGFFMLRSLENEQTPRILQAARDNGWQVMLDVVLNGDRPYWQLLEPLLPFADFFMPNENESEAVTGLKKPSEQAKRFLDAGAKAVLITQGENGVTYFDEHETFHTDIFNMEYVSGSGSGDAFCAGLIAGLLDGQNIEESIRWGSAVGASSVRGVSTTATVFNREELMEFLSRH